MLAKLNTFALVGIDAVPVEAEVDVSTGLPKTVLVGMPETGRPREHPSHRTGAAQSRLPAPSGPRRHQSRPADLRKEAGGYDLPIALGQLVATNQLLPEQLRDFATFGELALDGSLRPIKGALAMALAAAERGIPKLLVPAANAREAAVVENVAVYAAHTLAEAVGILSGELPAEPATSGLAEVVQTLNQYSIDFTDVRGQEAAKRALVVSASWRPQCA